MPNRRTAINRVTSKIEGMHCVGCAATIQALIGRIGGVRNAAVSFKEGEARVLYDPQGVADDQLTATIEIGGFRVTGRSDG